MTGDDRVVAFIETRGDIPLESIYRVARRIVAKRRRWQMATPVSSREGRCPVCRAAYSSAHHRVMCLR